jgi:hypothetical protein
VPVVETPLKALALLVLPITARTPPPMPKV